MGAIGGVGGAPRTLPQLAVVPRVLRGAQVVPQLRRLRLCRAQALPQPCALCLGAPQLLREHGALGVTECWGEDVPDGKVTDFKRAVALQDGETVAVGWITWPDRATRDAAWERLMQDERMMAMPMPFDGKRMIFAGFDLVLEG